MITKATLQTVSILAIENNSDHHNFLQVQARLCGLQDDNRALLWEKTLSSGIFAAGTHKPDIILLNLTLPDSTGIDTLLAIQNALPHTPVIILTEEKSLAIAALQAGARDYLISGQFDPDTLERSVRHVLAHSDLETRLRLYEAALNAIDSGVLITDQEAHILWVNTAFTQLTGYTFEETRGNTPSELLKSGLHNSAFYEEMWQTILSGKVWESELVNLRKDGTHYDELLNITPVTENGTILNFVAVMKDITERKLADERLRNLAFYDALTKLPNRRLLNDRLSQCIATGKRSGRYGALMFIDLDNFKPLNDTHSHAAGDLLLIEAAKRLKSCVREIDTIARFGSDEFIVLLSKLTENSTESITQADILSKKIRASLSRPYFLKLQLDEDKQPVTIEHHCTASIGVAVFSGVDTTAEEALKWADMAMYQAKENGRNLIVFHKPNN
jgi:diguanylate cyclase (GGDEF)-like protein/PAS domain S-box-containing protein